MGFEAQSLQVTDFQSALSLKLRPDPIDQSINLVVCLFELAKSTPNDRCLIISSFVEWLSNKVKSESSYAWSSYENPESFHSQARLTANKQDVCV